jgi:NAD(P)-dependent dehydrogenase (short-subunit alcohol dehydrogenase family)
MKIQNAVALVTGANRGLGLAFARTLLERGAKVYAAARDPQSIALPGAIPLRLDVTNPDDVAAAAKAAGDVSLLVNNAGITRPAPLLDAASITSARAELETNTLGPLALAQAFAPILAKNGGGTIVNVLSVLSWGTLPQLPSYSASKAAAWSFTNALRAELRPQGTQVIALHVGYMDTDMARQITSAKIAPAEVVRQTLDAVESGVEEVLADETSRAVKRGLSEGLYLRGYSQA